MFLRKFVALLFAGILVSPAAAQHGPLPFDTPHGIIGFTVPYTGGVTEVEGRFTDYAGFAEYTDESNSVESIRAEIVIQTASLNTGHEGRDRDVMSGRWFDVETYPEITFKSSRVEKSGDQYLMHGLLTMKGIEKEIAIPFERAHEDPYVWSGGRPHLGIRGTLTLNRLDFNLPESGRGGIITQLGELFLAEEVKLRLIIQAKGPGLADILNSTISESGIESALAQYAEMEVELADAGTYEFGENPLFSIVRSVRRAHPEATLATAEYMSNRYPDTARAHASLGLGYLEDGDIEKAIEHLSRAIEIDDRPIFRRILKEAEASQSE